MGTFDAYFALGTCVSEAYEQPFLLRMPKQANIAFIPQFGLQLSGILRDLESVGRVSGYA